jgi:hypothetical protein
MNWFYANRFLAVIWQQPLRRCRAEWATLPYHALPILIAWYAAIQLHFYASLIAVFLGLAIGNR